MRFQLSAELSKRQVEMANVIWQAVPLNVGLWIHSHNLLSIWQAVPLNVGLWIHSHNLLSSHCRTASEHQPPSAWVVLIDRSAQGKTGHPPSHSALTPSPSLPSVYYYSTSTSGLLE